MSPMHRKVLFLASLILVSPVLILVSPVTAETVGNWQVDTEVSPIDDSLTVHLTLKAENAITLTDGQQIWPAMTIRCQEGQRSAYITVDTPRRKSAELEEVTVRYGSKKAKKMKFRNSTDGSAFFFRDWDKVKKLKKHESLTLRYTPHLSGYQVVTFNLDGVDRAMNTLKKSCK